MTVCCVLLSGQLYWLGSATMYMVPSVVCVLVGMTRFRAGLMLIPIAVFGAICTSFVWESLQPKDLEAGFLATTALVAVASSDAAANHCVPRSATDFHRTLQPSINGDRTGHTRNRAKSRGVACTRADRLVDCRLLDFGLCLCHE